VKILRRMLPTFEEGCREFFVRDVLVGFSGLTYGLKAKPVVSRMSGVGGSDYGIVKKQDSNKEEGI